jgi:GNAT superfamily N-acetyltransferase
MSFEHYERGSYVVSTDPARLDVSAIHRFLSTSYWADSIPIDLVRRSLDASLCFVGLYAPEGQIGLVRVIADRATFAYLCDVYVLPAYQGQGLSHWLMQCVMAAHNFKGCAVGCSSPGTRTSCMSKPDSAWRRTRNASWRSSGQACTDRRCPVKPSSAV